MILEISLLDAVRVALSDLFFDWFERGARASVECCISVKLASISGVSLNMNQTIPWDRWYHAPFHHLKDQDKDFKYVIFFQKNLILLVQDKHQGN